MVKSLTPITTNYNGTDFVFNVWNRSYKMSTSPIFSSIVSGGAELLSSPMRFVGEVSGKDLAFDCVENVPINDSDDISATCSQFMQGNRLIVNTSIKTEYDGMVDCHVPLTSSGRTVAQVFGLEDSDKGERVLSKFWLDIPLKKEVARFYHYARQEDHPSCQRRQQARRDRNPVQRQGRSHVSRYRAEPAPRCHAALRRCRLAALICA